MEKDGPSGECKRMKSETDTGRTNKDGNFERKKSDNFPYISEAVSNEDELEKVVLLHLSTLDYYQSKVENIRMMHHAVWRDLRPDSVIIYERAGSRVERQIRIHHTGSGSDIDYKFIVKGIKVAHQQNSGLFMTLVHDGDFGRHSYCIIHCQQYEMERLSQHPLYCKVFQNAFCNGNNETEWILKPAIFKENVVVNSGFQMQRQIQPQLNSPNIAGQGATNATDAVPCLDLDEWPLEYINWHTRDMVNSDIFNVNWKLSVCKSVKMYVVPTGNRLSLTEDREWRLSFTFVEKECSSKIYEVCPKILKLFGIAKYVFKLHFEDVDILCSYHMKTIFLWKIEEYSLTEWDDIQPLLFVKIIIADLLEAVKTQTICHFFVADCNIFPFHKMTTEKAKIFEERAGTAFETAMSKICQVLRTDTGVSYSDKWMCEVKCQLQQKQTRNHGSAGLSVEAYIAGYLTRLLSIVVQSAYECLRTGAMDKYLLDFKALFDFEKNNLPLCDQHVRRIIPIAESEIESVVQMSSLSAVYVPIGSNSAEYPESRLSLDLRSGQNLSAKDIISLMAQKAFCAYTQGNLQEVKDLLQEYQPIHDFSEFIGITVTQSHASERKGDVFIDFPISYIKDELCSKGGKILRFYLHPGLLFEHLRLQMFVRENTNLNNDTIKNELETRVTELADVVQKTPHNEPFLGKLSYRHTAVFLLQGYQQFFRNVNIALTINIKDDPETIAKLRETTTNFDLR